MYNTKSAEFPIGRIFGRCKFGGPAAYPPNRHVKFPANISGHTVVIYMCVLCSTIFRDSYTLYMIILSGIGHGVQDLGVLLWSSAGKRLMVVSQGGHEEVRRFWRRQQRGT